MKSNEKLIIAYDEEDVIYYVNRFGGNLEQYSIYLCGYDYYKFKNHTDGFKKVYTIEDMWDTFKAKGIFEEVGNVATLFSRNLSDRFCENEKVTAIIPYFTIQHLWPYLRAVFEVEAVISELSPEIIYARVSNHSQIIALGSSENKLRSIFDYESLYRTATLRVVENLKIQKIFFRESRLKNLFKLIVRNFVHRLSGIYKFLSFFKTALKNKKSTKLEKGGVLFLSQSPVHESLIKNIAMSANLAILRDYAISVRKDAYSIDEKRHNLSKFRDRIKGWNFFDELELDCSTYVYKYKSIDLSKDILELLRQVYRMFPEYHNVHSSLMYIVKNVRPEHVYFGNDQVFSSMVMIGLCKEFGVPTSTVQHGWVGNPPINNVPLQSDSFEYFNNFTRDLFLKYGENPDKLAPTRKKNNVDYISNADKWCSNVTQITLISQGFIPYRDFAFLSFIELAECFPTIDFVVRLSPRDKALPVQTSLPNVFFDCTNPISEVIARSSIVIGFNSTVLFEAMLDNTPVFTFDLPFESENPFISRVNLLDKSNWGESVCKFLESSDFREEHQKQQNKLLRQLL
ncbi:hypothetical protein ACXAAV_01275 [Vibrio coralliilyticus]